MRDWTTLSQFSKDEVQRLDMYDSVKAYMLRYKNNSVIKGISNQFMRNITTLKPSHTVQSRLSEIYDSTESYYNDPSTSEREDLEFMLYDIHSASCLCCTKDFFHSKNFQLLILKLIAKEYENTQDSLLGKGQFVEFEELIKILNDLAIDFYDRESVGQGTSKEAKEVAMEILGNCLENWRSDELVIGKTLKFCWRILKWGQDGEGVAEIGRQRVIVEELKVVKTASDLDELRVETDLEYGDYWCMTTIYKFARKLISKLKARAKKSKPVEMEMAVPEGEAEFTLEKSEV